MSKKQDVRFALIPHPGCVCERCLMIGSNDFHYTQPFSPHGGRNSRCKCEFIPGIKGKTKVEGYDPEDIKKQWKAAKEIREFLGASEYDVKQIFNETGLTSLSGVSVKSFKDNWTLCSKTVGSDSVRDVLQEAVGRETSWLYFGEQADITFATENLMLEEINSRPHEIKTAEALSLIGIRCDFIIDSQKVVINGITQRVGLPDLANGYELKAIISSKNAYGAVKNHLENTVKKKGVVRVVIHNQGDLLDKAIIDAASVLAPSYQFETVSVLTSRGELVNVA